MQKPCPNATKSGKMGLAEAMAAFKFGVIAPLVNDISAFKSKDAFFVSAANRYYDLPDGSRRTFSSRTIKRWFYAYCRDGYEGLLKKERDDSSDHRAITDALEARIEGILKAYPEITTKSLYRTLQAEHTVDQPPLPSYITIHRWCTKYLEERQDDIRTSNNRIPFEFNRVNDCWQADTSHGPTLEINGRKVKTFIIAFIDDKSRFVTNIAVYLNDDSTAMLKTLSGAISRCGVPSRLFVDNGSSYKNQQLSIICAKLGISLINARPYSPQSKGKVERFFNTLKTMFLNDLDTSSFTSVSELATAIQSFVFHDYNSRDHSSLEGSSPKQVFSLLEQPRHIHNLQDIFVLSYKRKVRNDNTIRFNKRIFSFPLGHAGERIDLHIDLHDGSHFIFVKGERVPLNEVNLALNSSVRRSLLSHPTEEKEPEPTPKKKRMEFRSNSIEWRKEKKSC